MIHLDYNNKAAIAERHYLAVRDFVSRRPAAVQDKLYDDIRMLLPTLPPQRDAMDYDWLFDFILADLDTLTLWTQTNKKELGFTFFAKLYAGYFANGPTKFVDKAQTYNAFTFFEKIGINVCPYCDDEYIKIFQNHKGKQRSGDIDHFFPKADGLYPALAMCFYNLVPSCHTCNFKKLDAEVEANPYDERIESWSSFHSLVPLGANFDSLKLEDFKISLNTSHGMTRNNDVMGLESRYNANPEEIRKAMMGLREYSKEKCAEMLALGMPQDEIDRKKELTIGKPYPLDRGHFPHSKLLHDLGKNGV